MENNESLSPGSDTPDKTVSFKLPSAELALLKELCEQEGTTISDYMRKLLRSTDASVSIYDSLPRELQVSVDLKLTIEKLAQTESLLAQAQLAYEQERSKRKKLKKELKQITAELEELKREAEGGLGGMVTRYPQLGDMFGNALVRIGTSPITQRTLGSLFGGDETSCTLSEDEKALLAFASELNQKLSPEEMSQVAQICYRLVERKAAIPHVLKNLQMPAPPKTPPPGNPTASA